MHRIVLILFVSLLICSCSKRGEYDLSARNSSNSSAVNINIATADQLEKLPGIGRKTAESIVNYRSENGPFRRVEHIMLIRGVSERRFIELKPFLVAE